MGPPMTSRFITVCARIAPFVSLESVKSLSPVWAKVDAIVTNY